MTTCDLSQKDCVPCKGGVAPLTAEAARAMLAGLDGWTLSDDTRTISRHFTFKGFLKAQQMAMLAAWIGDHNGHHPDIRFGWGYTEVSFTTHEAGGLTENDFICAAKLDAALC